MLGRIIAVTTLSLALAGCGAGGSRDQIKIVGSSTVYPFTTTVAEQFVNKNPKFKTPVVESTGTGGGVKLFCEGIGPQYPDILDASRAMTLAEFKKCQANGVTQIMQIEVGADGVALAESLDGPKFSLTRKDIYLALAANPKGKPNTAKTWQDVNPDLPAIPIQVLGPPSTSGTRDAFVELMLEAGCLEADPDATKLKADADPDKYASVCKRIRDDGAYVDKGENDNLIVQNLASNPNAVGIFGYSYLEENKERLRGIPVDGVEPTYETIAMKKYPGARPLFIYVKKQHMNAIPGLPQFLAEYAASWGADGPLVKKGMIAAPRTTLFHSKALIDNGTVITDSDLK